MSAISCAIVDIEGQEATPSGQDRRRAVALVFVLCLAVASALVGRDGPLATAPIEVASTLSLPAARRDATIFTFPGRLANDRLTNLEFSAVPIRGTEGLAARVGSPGGVWVVTWTERGTAYLLSSADGDVPDHLRLAGSLR